MGVTDDVNKTPTPLKVDPLTGRLMVDINLVASLPAYTDPAIPVDDNREPAGIAVTDDANRTPKPLLCDANGLLIVDLIFG